MANVTLCHVLVLTIWLRPLNIDGLLLHDHGEEGRHVHALALSSGESLEVHHLRFHDHEHRAAASTSGQIQAGGGHSEDCSSVVIDFGEKNAARCSSRTDSTLIEKSVAECPLTITQSSCSFVADVIVRAQPLSAARPFRALDAILASSGALLI